MIEDHPLLYSKKLKKSIDSNRKLTYYFVKKLTMRFGLNEEKANNCAKAPAPVMAKVMELCHTIVSKNKPLKLLAVLKDWLCPEMKIVSKALSDKLIEQNVKSYINRHIFK